MRAKHLVGGSLSNFLVRTLSYTRLEPDWYEYYLRLESLKESLGALVREGLSNGSVICGKEDAHHIVMVHPERAAALKLGSGKPKLHFIFSRELPRGWLFQDYTLAARRAKARDWMIRAFRHFEREGRRVTRNDLMELAQEFFGLTENAAKDAWKEARGPVGNPTNNFEEKMKAKLSEIRRID